MPTSEGSHHTQPLKIAPFAPLPHAGRRQPAAVVICADTTFSSVVRSWQQYVFALPLVGKEFPCAKAYRLIHAEHDSQGKRAKCMQAT